MTQATCAAGWPVLRGIQTVKEVSFLNMRQASAAAQLAKLWSDTFLTNAGIYAAGSSDYTYRGSANYDVIKTAGASILTPIMTNYSAPSGNVYHDSEYSASYASWKAFDQSTTYDGNHRWGSSNSAFPHWVAYKFSTGKTAASYKIASEQTDRNLKSWKVQGSNDSTNGADGTWTDLDTQTDITFANPEVKTFSIANPASYTMYRLLISKNSSNETATGYVYVSDFQLFPAPAVTASIVSVLALDLAADVTQVMMFADVTLGTGTAAYYASTDDGVTWTAVIPETLATVPAGKKIRIKVELTGDAELESWGVAV